MSTRYGTTRLIVAAVFTAVLLAPAAAAAPSPALSIKGGLNISTLSFEDDVDDSFFPKDSRKGLIVGVSFRKDFRPKVGLQIEGLYAQTGTTWHVQDDLLVQTFRVDYFQIPVLMSFPAARTDTF